MSLEGRCNVCHRTRALAAAAAPPPSAAPQAGLSGEVRPGSPHAGAPNAQLWGGILGISKHVIQADRPLRKPTHRPLCGASAW